MFFLFRFLPCLVFSLVSIDAQRGIYSDRTLYPTTFRVTNRLCKQNHTCVNLQKRSSRTHDMCMRGACEKINCGITTTMCNSYNFRKLMRDYANELRTAYAKRYRITNMNALTYDQELEYMAFCMTTKCGTTRHLYTIGCSHFFFASASIWYRTHDTMLREVDRNTNDKNYHNEERIKMMLRTMFANLRLLAIFDARWIGCARRAFRMHASKDTFQFALVCLVRRDNPFYKEEGFVNRVAKGKATKCEKCLKSIIGPNPFSGSGECNHDHPILCGNPAVLPGETLAVVNNLLQEQEQDAYDHGGSMCPEDVEPTTWKNDEEEHYVDDETNAFERDYHEEIDKEYRQEEDEYEYYDEDDEGRSRKPRTRRTRTIPPPTCPTFPTTAVPFVPTISEESKKYMAQIVSAFDRMLTIVDDAFHIIDIDMEGIEASIKQLDEMANAVLINKTEFIKRHRDDIPDSNASEFDVSDLEKTHHPVENLSIHIQVGASGTIHGDQAVILSVIGVAALPHMIFCSHSIEWKC